MDSTFCYSKHFEGKTEKRPSADNEPDIWSDFVSVRYGGIYTHNHLAKQMNDMEGGKSC